MRFLLFFYARELWMTWGLCRCVISRWEVTITPSQKNCDSLISKPNEQVLLRRKLPRVSYGEADVRYISRTRAVCSAVEQFIRTINTIIKRESTVGSTPWAIRVGSPRTTSWSTEQTPSVRHLLSLSPPSTQGMFYDNADCYMASWLYKRMKLGCVHEGKENLG